MSVGGWVLLVVVVIPVGLTLLGWAVGLLVTGLASVTGAVARTGRQRTHKREPIDWSRY